MKKTLLQSFMLGALMLLAWCPAWAVEWTNLPGGSRNYVQTPLKPQMSAGTVKAPRKTNVTVDDLVGTYTAISNVDESNYWKFKAEVQATDVEDEVLLTGLWYFNKGIRAKLDADNSRLEIELGQVAGSDYLNRDYLLASFEYDPETGETVTSTSGSIYASIGEDGVISFDPDVSLNMTAGEQLYSYNYLSPGTTLTPGFADFAITPLDDMELTYLNDNGDYVGNYGSLVEGLAWNSKDEQYIITVTTTDLVNVADPDDQILLSVGDNLETYYPILVGGNEIVFNESSGYGNEPIITIAGEWEYVYIDNYGSDADFEKVKDVLAGKIAVCNRGGNSFYVKANAAMKYGAAGIIIVNNQDGTFNMNLSGYEYDKPAVSITMADGALLKSNATYVGGDAPYYQGTLTISNIEKTRHEPLSMYYGDSYLSENWYAYARVPDWTNATPGATYKATINYAVTQSIWDEENIHHINHFELTPTVLTLVVPNVEGMLDVCGERVTNANAADILGNGAFSYDDRTKTLHIKKSYEYDDNYLIHNWDIDGLTIAVDNDVTLTNSNNPDFAMWLWASTTITGPGMLTFYGNINIINGSTLTIDNADLELQLCASKSIFGNLGGEKLIVKNSNIHAKSYYLAISDFTGGITLEACTLADGCTISADGASIVNASGNEATEVTINKIDDDAINNIIGTQNDSYFTLDGRMLQTIPSQRGIYINAGKKVLVK